jgi:hypothetical protein
MGTNVLIEKGSKEVNVFLKILEFLSVQNIFSKSRLTSQRGLI